MKKKCYQTPLLEDCEALLGDMLTASTMGLNDYDPKDFDWDN